MTAARYLLVFCLGFCLLIALAAADAWAQFGTPTRNGYYVCAYIGAKIAHGSTIPSPKLVIVAGSNALAGIDAERLGDKLSVRVFNFGLSASMGPGFQTFEGAKILRPGDAVLMPFEYLAYDYNTPRDALVDTVYSCGTDYWHSLSWTERIFFVLAVRPERIVDSYLFRSHPQAMQATAALAAADVGPYGQRPGGNFPPHEVAVEAGMTNQPLEVHLDPASAGTAAIARFVSWAHAHRIVVFATWPNTIEFPGDRSGFSKIAAFYRNLGVDVIGTPQQAMLPSALMGGRFYHPNRKGMAVRTARLIEALQVDPAFRRWRAASNGEASRH